MPNRHILVADDNRDAADSLVDVLRAAGFDAEAVYDGKQAVAAGRTTHPAIALLDVQMPGLDGCEAARRLRAQPDGPIRIASISGLDPNEEPMRSMHCHFDEHFRKPANVARLVDFVNQSFNAGTG